MRGAVPPLPEYVFMAWSLITQCIMNVRSYCVQILGKMRFVRCQRTLLENICINLLPSGCRGLFSTVKRPGREPDHSPPSSAEVKKCVDLYLHSPSTLARCHAQEKQSTGTTLPFTYHEEFRSRVYGR
jgi:hypothetical protein